MTNAPERIWACMGGPMVGLFVSGGNNGGWPEYVRADIVQALTAERDGYRKALEDIIKDYEPGYPLSHDVIKYVARAALEGESHE